MHLHAFERQARADWRRIPQHFKQGIDGVIVRAEAVSHPDMDDVYTMGECITESYPSDFGSAETIRSAVVLYYGSFAKIAADADDFDWEGEIWETLTHELQHHLESLAGDDTLGDMDYAANENFKRLDGKPFDAFFYREGESLPDGEFRVEEETFFERPLTATSPLHLTWRDRDVRIAVPDVGDADVAYITLVDHDGPLDPPVCLVLIRKVTGLRAIAAMIRPRQPVVVHAEGLTA